MQPAVVSVAAGASPIAGSAGDGPLAVADWHAGASILDGQPPTQKKSVALLDRVGSHFVCESARGSVMQLELKGKT